MKAILLFLWLALLTGVVYPLTVLVIGNAFFPKQAQGSLLSKDGKVVGSALIAQKFESDKYFWPRPSATDYNPLLSGGSNLSQTSRKLKDLMVERKDKILKTLSLPYSEIPEVPPELLFASGSGLDPHISPRAAFFQVDRIIKARGLDSVAGQKLLVDLITSETYGRFWGFVGKNRVNVLRLNLFLDELQ